MAPSLEISPDAPVAIRIPALDKELPKLPIMDGKIPEVTVQDAQSTTTELPYPRLDPNFELEEHPVDVVRKLKVAVIGAGLSGITAGILLPAKVPEIQLQIFDKNANVGGTWFENVYPGVRCDIPANVYQSTFEPNTQWTEEYAQGAEIRDYWQRVAKKHKVYEHLKLSHKINGINWSDEKSVWGVNIEDLTGKKTYTEDFDVVITAIGRFNAWKIPDYPGINDFKGLLRHSSNWDPNFDPKGKTVAVIGNGASGIQVVPNLQPLVKHLDHYARNPTWIAGSFGGEGDGRTLEPKYYSPELLKSFEDPETYYKFRKELEGKFYTRFGTVFKNTEENRKLRADFVQLMAKRLEKKPELLDIIVPDFSPNCRRLTPGPGYLEALTQDNVSYITTPISHFTSTSVVTTDGTSRTIDAVICSTGANSSMHPPFPITTPTSTLATAWTPDPITYLGLSTPSLPNLLFIAGPNATGHSGTIPQQVETQITYLAKLLRKVSREGYKTFEPSTEATDDFMAYSDAFFPRTVQTEKCSSWANGGRPGGRIHGVWPGSASHVNWVRREPRWEDWVWGYGKEGRKNRFGWLGNGWTMKEEKGEGDLTPYLKPGKVDLKTVHEVWCEGLED